MKNEKPYSNLVPLSAVGLKKIRANEEKDAKQEEQEIVHAAYEDMNVLALIGRVKQLAGKHRVVVLKTGACNAFFYDEVNRGNIHNGKSEFLSAAQLPAFIWTMF